MSKTDLLTTEEIAVASSQGWCLAHIFDTEKKRWVMNVLPIEFKDGISAPHAQGFVIQQARNNNLLCQKALSLITQFNQKQK